MNIRNKGTLRKTIALVLMIALAASLAACGAGKPAQPQAAETAAQNTDVKVNVAALSGPTGMGMAYLNEQSDKGNTAYKYDITYASAPDLLTGGLISGELQIAALPVNLAAVLYNKTGGEVLTAAVNTLGVLYIVESGQSVNSLSDLKGKSVIASGKGSTPEYVLEYLLDKNDLTGLVGVEYTAEHDEALAALVSEQTDLVMLPEPKVTAALTQAKDSRIAVDITDEWSRAAGTELVQGVIVVQKKFAAEHPEIVDAFLKEYKESVDYTNSNVQEVSFIIEKYGIIPNATVAQKALPNCNIVCITGSEMQDAVTGMLDVLYRANPAATGGSLPGAGMFYK